MIVIIINREMAVDTASELELPTPPSDGLERDSSPTFDAVLLRHTHTRTHTYALQGFTFATKSRRARPSATYYQTAPLRPAPDSFFDFSFSIIIIITKELLEKAWRQFYLAGR